MSEMLGNRYQITKLIGKGGMADVYLAIDTILNREVAIKILKEDMSNDPNALERFSREALASTELSHPNIVDVYDVGDDKDKHYIVMEYVKGYTLKQLIRRRGAIPFKEAVWIMKQLSGALMEAHRKGMVHRDVKSQNVLIKDDGTIKLTDFGIALAQGAMQITHKDSILGSVHYLAPEVAKGQVATMQSDIYSLGIVFFELLTGDVPYKADSAVQVALLHVKGKIPSVRKINSDIPQSVENILIKATAKSCENRYKNMALMLRDLSNCLKPEYINCPKLELNRELEQKTVESMKISNTSKKKKKKQNTVFSVVFLVTGIIISLLLVLGILLFTGVLGGKNSMVEVPDVSGYTVIEANDILDQSKLSLDTANLEWMFTDDVPEGVIISTSPEAGSSVDKNTKVTAKVSEGILAVLKDYKGKKFDEVKKELEDLGFKVTLVSKESDVASGLVISTDPEANFKYEPNNAPSITVTYSAYKEIILSEEMRGKKVSKATSYFDDLGIKYKLSKQDKSFFTELELDGIEPNDVVYTSPSLGLSYTQDETSFVTIYYYEGD